MEQIGDINNKMKNISIILVKPQLAKNIGSVARIIKNLNCYDLRIVNPRDGWPNENTISTAAGADDILNTAKVFDTVENACNDLNFLYATTWTLRTRSDEFVRQWIC